jgi:site-specific DNA recombinase
MKAVIYLRISSDPEDQRLGVSRQAADCRAAAEERGAEVVRTYEDNDVSATRGQRPAWRRMLRDLEAGLLGPGDLIVAWKADRLYRRLTDFEALGEATARHGVHVITSDGVVDFDSAQAILAAAIAKVEAANTRARVLRAKQELARQGKPSGGRRAYGFEPDGITHRPEEAAIVREVADRVLGGEALQSVARDLEARGVASAEGGRWTAGRLRALLLKPRMAGYRTYRGEVVGDAVWQPVIDRATWKELQDHLRQRDRGPRGHNYTSLLGGIARCGRCGTSMNRAGERGYRCNRSIGGCGRVKRNQAWLDKIVTEQAIERIERRLRRRVVDSADRHQREAEARLVEVRALQEDARQRFAAGRLPGAGYLDLLEALHTEERGLVEVLEGAETARAEVARHMGIRSRWAHMPLADRREALLDVVEAVIVKPSTTRGRTPLSGRDIEIAFRGWTN